MDIDIKEIECLQEEIVVVQHEMQNLNDLLDIFRDATIKEVK